MKTIQLLTCFFVLLFSATGALGKTKSLEEKLDSLNLPVNEGPRSIAKEKLYSVQKRLSSLTSRHELTLDMATNLNVDGHLRSQQLGGAYHYHFTDKWSMGIGGYKIFNELTDAGDQLLEKKFIAPNKDFARHQAELFVSYNIFYGKFRIGANSIFYFDQYFTLGAGMVGLRSGDTPMLAPDLGLALWLGKNLSIRSGVRNELYNETTVLGKDLTHNVLAYLKVGYLFGGDR